jgi:hypothetical protein
MAEKPTEQTFAQFLEEQPAAETVTLTGRAARSAKPGSFSFVTAGQTMELPTDAVKRHKVVSEGPQRLVEIEIVVSEIDPKILKSVLADGIKHPNADPVTFKEVTTDLLADKPAFKDPIVDPVSLIEPVAEPGFAADPDAGAQPFVLATPHHAPASAIAAQMGGPAARMASAPITDPATALYFDRAHTRRRSSKIRFTIATRSPRAFSPTRPAGAKCCASAPCGYEYRHRGVSRSAAHGDLARPDLDAQGNRQRSHHRRLHGSGKPSGRRRRHAR